MRFFIFALAPLIFIACSHEGGKEEAVAEEQSALPEGFTTFYQQFHSDSIFQMEHIVFPLEGLPDNADSLTLARQDFHWLPENWRMQRQFDFGMSDFRRELIPINENMVVERIIHKSGEMGMVRRFALVGNEWNLIYYTGMNRIAR